MGGKQIRFKSRACHFTAGRGRPCPRRSASPSRPVKWGQSSTYFGQSGRSANASFLPACRPHLVFPSSLFSLSLKKTLCSSCTRSLLAPLAWPNCSLSRPCAPTRRPGRLATAATHPRPDLPSPRPPRAGPAPSASSFSGCGAPTHRLRGRGEAGRAGQGRARVAEGTGRGGGLGRQASERQPDRSPRATLQIAAVSSRCPASLWPSGPWDFLSLLPAALSAPWPLPPPLCAFTTSCPTRDGSCEGGAARVAEARKPALTSGVPEVE